MVEVTLRTARSQHPDPEVAAEEIAHTLGAGTPKLVTLFASRSRDHVALNRAVRARFGRAVPLIGASTAGEIDNAGFHGGSIVVGALYGDLEATVGLGTKLSRNAIAAGAQAINAACHELGTRARDLDVRRHVGVVIDDGFRYKKEELQLGVLEQNPGLILVGGGASDAELDPAKQSSLVHLNDDVATDAVLVALIRSDAPWAAQRAHWYEPTHETVTITRVDETHTRALEIDGKPAASRYAEILGCAVDELEFGTPRGFAVRPTALQVGREYFIRAPWKPLPDGSILFANLLEEGVELVLMKRGDMVAMTERFFREDLPARVQNPKALLAFHCGGRYWVAQGMGCVEALGRTFQAAPPCAGLNVHFETYCGFHVNSTLTTLAFGSSP